MTQAVRIRPDIAQMEGYTFVSGTYPALSEKLGLPIDQIIKLDTNESLYGPLPKARAALAALGDLVGDPHIYPDIRCDDLRALLADYVGIDMAHILVGCGADELIDLTFRLFLEPGDTILNCPPTFTMYTLTAKWIGNTNVVDIPRHADFSLDVEKIEDAALQTNAKLLCLCSPNNPDGSTMPPETLERLLKLPLVIVLDEAYIEFAADEGFSKWVAEVPNLIVLRTFSKWAGLAGMRIGYGLYPLDIIQHLWKIKHPFNMTVASDIAAQATLRDLEAGQVVIQKIITERERLYSQLQRIPYLEIFPSQGNFILARVKNPFTAHELKQKLDQIGILIRDYKSPSLLDYVRISVGKPEHSDALIAALQTLGGL